jgi:SpoVK/Ycf46/Vps4 family AAA+-type ATPase
MQKRNEAMQSLREAVRLSPDNIPLRQHFADTLMSKGLFEEAEKEYRAALSFAPDDAQLKLGLANAFFKQNKRSAALVVLENLLENSDAPPKAHLLYARILMKSGEKTEAMEQYRKALQLDPSLADPTLAEQLGFDDMFETENGFDDELIPLPSEFPEEDVELEMERPDNDFSHVGGMEDLKDEIRMKIIHPLTHPEIYEAYGKPIGGGILMYGPPGCGKTHLARATAGEVKAGFISVGIHDVLDMWIGNSERNLHELFEFARDHKPCVLFFDEVDALGASRSDMRKSGGRQLINQFLAELDGFNATNEGLLILAATNAPWHLDPAFRRPGRFDRVLFVPPPDVAARTEILHILLKGKPVDDVDYEFLAKKTGGFSGADLKAVIDVAIEEKLKAALQKGVPEPLMTKDLQKAVKSLKATTNEWFSTARNYALYANQGGIYDDIVKYLKL